MDIIRDAIVKTLRAKFPEMADSIIPYTGQLDERSDQQVSYAAPGILVCILECVETPDQIAPWELDANFGLVMAVKEASARERDIAGWKLCMEVALVAYGNTWGINPLNIRPARFVSITKNTLRLPDGTPSGLDYWTILLHNWIKFEAFL